MISTVAQVFAAEWPRVVATLVRDLGDLGLAEDAAADAFAAAAESWGANPPQRPGAWLVTTARRKAIDRVRRDNVLTRKLADIHETMSRPTSEPSTLGDEQLALVFGCCHPALATDAQVALTLRAVCGLSTAQIARAFLVSEPTMAKRLVRAKNKLRAAGISFRIPESDDRIERLDAVLRVVYLIFTQGHAATDGPGLVRGDLCDEARWLAALLADLLPSEGEASGLAALLDLTDARRAARVDADGLPVMLQDQNRGLWDGVALESGLRRFAHAASHQLGHYGLQAAIAAVHATARTPDTTDWTAIVRIYDELRARDPGPIIELNRAVAVAMADGPAAGLVLLDELAEDPSLADYHYLPSARADLLRRLGRWSEAANAYDLALALCANEAERRFLAQRRSECESR